MASISSTVSHWSAKLVVSDLERGSASMRRTCFSSSSGLCSLPAVAALSSSLSGPWLHRKNDRREASSTSLIV